MNIEDEKQLSNKYTIIIMVVIFLIALLIAGGTYAFMVYDMSISNKNIASSTVCFDIVYDADNDTSPITGTLIPSSGPGGGLSGKISIGMNSNCNISVYGNFYLNITNGSDVLFQTVDAHCENSQTLRTLVDYKDQASCEAQTNGKWVTDGTALKYAIYTTNDITASTVSVKVDYIDSIGEKNIYENFSMTNVTVDYYVYVWLDGNLIDNEYANQSLAGDISASVSQVESGGVSGYTEAILNGADPVLDSGMIPVTIANDGIATVADTSQEWYSYQDKQWANAVLVKENATEGTSGSYSREYYKNNPGTPVLESDILAYYVWIPRYKYTFPNADETPETISVVFENSSTTKSVTTSGSASGTEYYTHPAFTFGSNNELNGIWVGKFETTGDATTPTIKPNVSSLRNQNVSDQFTASLKFAGGTLSDGVVTFEGSVVYGLIQMTDSHMMKNSEWGAVAYLSHSQYGINSEIRINNNSNYTTGCGASEENGESTTECQIIYGSNVTSYPQSTTGNITGIFDMSGSAGEYVMGVYSDSEGKPMSGFNTFKNSNFNGTLYDGTSYSDGISFPESKYYDLYLSSQFTGLITGIELCTLETCGGHALNETAWWYDDFGDFISSTYPWFIRGGYYEDGSDAGEFYILYDNGYASDSNSWRSVLVVDGV